MLVTFLAILALLAVALVFLVLPGESDAAQRAPFWGRNIAHRGLHSRDKSVPENSLPAFTLAVDAGYGIELDVRLTKDEEVVVFHDDDLARVCGVNARVDEKTLEELKRLRLCGTAEPIPTLREVLDLVDGGAPLVIEVKMGPKRDLLCEKTWRTLRTYDGDICIESFDPRIVRWFMRHVPGVLRGQLSAPPKELKSGALGVLVGTLLTNFWARPHFIAYMKGKKPFTVHLAERFAMRIVWTLHPEDNTLFYEEENDAAIFEFYTPEPVFKELPAGLIPDDFADVLQQDEVKTAQAYSDEADGGAAEDGDNEDGNAGAADEGTGTP